MNVGGPLGYAALKLCSERLCAQRRPRPNPLLADPAAAAIRRVIMEEYAR